MFEQVLTFTVGETLLGIDVKLIKEVNKKINYEVVPQSENYVLGLFNMRGQVVTILDLAVLIELSNKSTDTRNSCIILKYPRDPNQVGFLVSSPGEVIDIVKDQCELPPANVGGIKAKYINYIVKLDHKLLIVIEPENFIKSDIDGLVFT